MKKLFTLLFLIAVTYVNLMSQPVTSTGLPPNPTGAATWGTNVLLLNTEPIGPMHGIKASNGTIYVAINDTLSTTSGLIIRKSTDNGATWTTHGNSLTNRINFPRIKLLEVQNDSVICWLMFGTQVYGWNINTNAIRAFDSTTVNDFDIVKSSTNSIYLWITTNSGGLRRFASITNGYTWQNAGYVQANSRNIRLAMSVTSDTLLAAYRSPVNTTIEKSILRLARYRESAPGTLASMDFKDMADSSALKTEFNVAVSNSVAWYYYTSGSTGAIDIYCRTSIDNGLTFGTAFLAAGNPNTDEYYFDVGISGTTSTKYCDFIYYSDSLQSGSPTNNTDKLMYRFASSPTPGTFTTATQISQFYPHWSSANCKPIIVEVGNSDVGAAWVGGSASVYKVYWNRYSLTGIRQNLGAGIPDAYSLKQNYPNPFNPTTSIDFDIKKAGMVSLKIYDILGKELSTLVSQRLEPGKYSYTMNAASLSSGTYFYRLEVNGYVETKKMSLIK
ncbi:MAG: T9SS type A sorting domain-containing protein [Bacteroidetes bacterium]|nr:T9SS type A sorting domain-containing protein [Bacteroidota bacterium]